MWFNCSSREQKRLVCAWDFGGLYIKNCKVFNHILENLAIFSQGRNQFFPIVMRAGRDFKGRLYTWAAAMDSAGIFSTNGKGCGDGKNCYPQYPVRGICPAGWHLPTEAEYRALFTTVGGKSTAGKMLRSTRDWNGIVDGTDAFNFAALPAGSFYVGPSSNWSYLEGIYAGFGTYAHFWSSTPSETYTAYSMGLSGGKENADLDDELKDQGFSVRCVKNN